MLEQFEDAFYGCKNLKKITVQSSIIKKVGAKAFKGIIKEILKSLLKKYKAYKKHLKEKVRQKQLQLRSKYQMI